MPRMTDGRLRDLGNQIDDLNDRAAAIVKEIRASSHPKATEVANALDEECVILASAGTIVDDCLSEER